MEQINYINPAAESKVLNFPQKAKRGKITKGKTIIRTNGTVDPLKSIEDIQTAKAYFQEHNLRDYCLFVVSLNCARRVSDTLQIKIKDVLMKDGVIRDKIFIKEKKTGKISEVTINDNAKEAIILYLNSIKYDINDYLFKSRQGGNQPISRRQALNIYKKMADEIGLTERGINIGTHSTRKTFAYQCLSNPDNSNKPMTLTTLQKAFNHSSPEITLRYSGIGRDEVRDLYMNNGL